jgi:hypothetical protein
MALGLGDQFERLLRADLIAGSRRPWREARGNYRFAKTGKHRRERRRARANPECLPEYRRYNGWEY